MRERERGREREQECVRVCGGPPVDCVAVCCSVLQRAAHFVAFYCSVCAISNAISTNSFVKMQ